MNVTCALILVSPKKKILLVHPTMGRHIGGWSIPKGIADDGEDMIDAAIRELREETAFDMAHARDEVVPIGRYPYTKEKDIFYAYWKSTNEVDVSTLLCESHFTHKHGTSPEVDNFMMVDFDDALVYLNKKQAAIFKDFKNILHG
jgi:8-oxo-dGTP pyrophosphatase MutT (NUDIX family)